MKYLLLLVLLSANASAETLLTVTEGGTVSINNGLTSTECEKLRKHLDPADTDKWPKDKDGNFVSWSRSVSNGDIKQVECLQ